MELEEYEQAEAYYSAHPSEQVRELWLVYCLLSNGADEQRRYDLSKWVDRAKRELEDADCDWSKEPRMITSARKVKSGSYQLGQRPDGTVHLTACQGSTWEGERTIELSPSDVAALAKDLIEVIEVKK